MLGRSIVAKASFWWERLDIKQFVPELSSNSEAQVSQRLERWCNVVAQGNWDKFQRRLQWDGLDIDQVRPCLGTVRLVAEQLPKWANTLAQVVEYVEHQACENEAAAQRFYQRAGMLLCWLYALRGIDCHYQNLIASGEHLLLVDLETLLDPEVKLIDNSLDAQEMESTAGQQFYDSVLRTGLLPRWDFSSDRSIAYDISGLGSIESQPSSNKAHKARCWKAINTDDMHLGYDNITLPRSKNVPGQE